MNVLRIVLLAGIVSSVATSGHASEGDTRAAASGGSADRVAALETAVEVLTEEVARLRDRSGDRAPAAAPQAPGAEKVFSSSGGVSLGGYGEFYFTAPLGDDDGDRIADYHRFITYVGAKFSPRIVMNTELEFEHGTTARNPSDQAGSVSVEFSYLDFLLAEDVHLRAGSVLIPMGFVNLIHEPPFRRGNLRPTVEKNLLPTTWRELGAGVQAIRGGVRVDAFVVNGLDAIAFGKDGIRDGRQKGNRARWEDVAFVLATRVEPGAGMGIGASVFTGEADQGRSFAGGRVGARLTVVETHAEFRRGPLRARALVVGTAIGEADRIAAEVGEAVPSRQRGGYVEASLAVGRFAGVPAGQELLLWSRVEDWDLQRELPAGLTRDPSLDARSVTVGVEYFPVPEVVLKLDGTRLEDDAGDTTDTARFGAGFVF